MTLGLDLSCYSLKINDDFIFVELEESSIIDEK